MYFSPREIERERSYLCKEGVFFSTDGGLYLGNKRISPKHVLPKTENPDYVNAIAKEHDVDPVILQAALLTQVKINAGKNISYIADNPLRSEIVEEEVTVPEYDTYPGHMPGMGGFGGSMNLDDASVGDNFRLVTKLKKKIVYFEKYVFNDEGLIVGKEELETPVKTWY